MTAVPAYPVRVDASLDVPLSRWRWLVKWLLALPHYVVLAFLWVAFVVLSIVAFFAILVTGRYPRSVFEFNVGVLRWTWRVQYYAIGAFGTDRYPPFTLDDVPDYPARLSVEYPAQLSRGLVLVKWWLLAIPHYLIVGLFVGGLGWQIGLIGLLVLVAAVILLFTGRYPEQIFDFVLGLNRWVLRVAAYAGLMTDEYPPFRLDMGGSDPGGTLTLPSPGQPVAPAPTSGSGWTGGRIASVVSGALVALLSLGLLGAGGWAVWAQTSQRHDGYVDLATASYRTSGYALVRSQNWSGLDALAGTMRFRVTPTTGVTPVFLGIARSHDVDSYLAGVRYATVHGKDVRTRAGGTALAVPPTGTGIWTVHATGTGTLTLDWKPQHGDWALVAMNADGSRPVDVRVKVAATVPGLPWIAGGLLAGGVVFLAGAVALIAVPMQRARQHRSR